ncbi:uncharacterized protein LOC133542839 isoform X3 [Nerophis ophidion]|uniref:uncharacterized protein LOC133542839 isoform X3 n=1 Tax=Nerophis ophidion TaxID=159077 RepID=UPI002ADF9B49|nr:uncharacterized protein LOC133542839 isoform X3 [Nerophis ophidion]
MMKHLRVHGVQINACSVFDALRRPTSDSSSCSGSDAQPGTSVTALQSESDPRFIRRLHGLVRKPRISSGQGPEHCCVDEEVLDGQGSPQREARTSTLARLTEEDFRKAEDFISLMKVLYTSTLCVSSEKSPTCGQILPILKKLEAHLAVKAGDTVFV